MVIKLRWIEALGVVLAYMNILKYRTRKGTPIVIILLVQAQ